MESKRQPKLRTFEDVFHRIRWDDKYNMLVMRMGYDDRLLGAMEMPLSQFVPVVEGGELPMHRVWYVRSGRDVLWDRRRKLDLVFGSGSTPAILAAGQESADEETTRRIEEAVANVQRVEEEQQHNLEVRLHAQRHAARRLAGMLPGPSCIVKKTPENTLAHGYAEVCLEPRRPESDKIKQTPQKIQNHDGLCQTVMRSKLILGAFRACDVDGDGCLSVREMQLFATRTGFDGNNEEWAVEYASLCSDMNVETISFSVFENLVNDATDRGCHCTDDELRTMLVSLRCSSLLAPDAANLAVSAM
jgi:uncharacterized protein (UPF0248 family)